MNKYFNPEYYYENIPTQETLGDEDMNLISSTSKEKIKPSHIYFQKPKEKFSKFDTPTREIIKMYPGLEEEELEIDPFKFISSRHIFLDEYCRNAMKSGREIQIARQEAFNKWNTIKAEEKGIYEKLAKELYNNAIEKQKYKNLNKINSYNLFIKDRLAEARQNNRVQNTANCARLWEKISPWTKEQYAKYANIVRKEYLEDLRRKIFKEEYLKNIKKLSWGPFRFFLINLIKNDFDTEDIDVEKEVDNIHKYAFDASKLWEEMSDEEKENFEAQALEEKYEYVSLKWEYVFNEKRKNKKPRSPFIIFANKLKSNLKINDTRGYDDFEFFYEQWSLLEADEKDMYIMAAEKEKTDYQEEMTERIKNREKYSNASIYEKQIETKIKPMKRKHVDEENIEGINHSKRGKYINNNYDRYNN